MRDFAADLARAGGEPRLLVRCTNWVGDAVMSLPGLGALRRSVPGARLAVVARPWVSEVVEMSDLADEVVIFDDPGVRGTLGLAYRLGRRGFDGAVLFQNAFRAAFLAAAARVPLRGGYATDGRRLLLTHPVRVPGEKHPSEHQVGYYTALVRELGFGAEPEKVPRIALPGPPARERDLVALAPGASFGPAKMWPLERFLELGRRLSRRGFRLVVMGSAAESESCARVAAGIGPAARDLSGRTTLREAAGHLARATVTVSNDSGLMHLAGAVGSPLVALFGSTSPEATGPVWETSVVIRGTAPCAPCFGRVCPRGMECFDDVTVDRVEEACLALAGGEGESGS